MAPRIPAPARTARARAQAAFAADVRCGLLREGPKELPSKYLYDAMGSALFEAISLLPEYGLTRADERLLRRHAGEIAALAASPARARIGRVVELGSGTGKKARWLLEELCRRHSTSYFPIDVSRAALAACRAELGDIPALRITGCLGEYLDGLREAAAGRGSGERMLVLFLGSTIGNFDRAGGTRFLGDVRRIFEPGDGLLLGTDLEKPEAQLLRGYDDPLGITAAFNRNLLARINRELGANFDLRNYEHVARYNQAERRIEMYLRAEREQTVRIPKAGFSVTLRAGETIWTESSHKYAPEEPRRMAEQCGFRQAAQWIDAEWSFAETLLLAS